MSYQVRQDTNPQPLVFMMVQSSDHSSPALNLSPTVKISKNGGPFIIPAGVIAEIGYGWYKIQPVPGDVDIIGPLILHADATGADPVDTVFEVVYYRREIDEINTNTTLIPGTL